MHPRGGGGLWHASECVRRVHAGGVEGVGVKALSLAVTDGALSQFTLGISPKRLGHISVIISNRVLCLYGLIKDGRKQREGASIVPCTSVTVDSRCARM